MAKARKGTLQWRPTGWFARITIDVDGEAIRRWFDLGTTNRAVAVRKMARLAAQHAAGAGAEQLQEAAQVLETYAEAAKRIRDQREAEGVRDVQNERIRDAKYLVPHIGNADVRLVRAGDIRAALDAAAELGKSAQTLKHIRAAAFTVFDALWREETIADNPVARVKVPKRATDKRERAVLTDAELVHYLGWQHPQKHRRKAVVQRQVMACVSRMFGGLRTGDLHALRWESLDAEGGRFDFGWAPRRKTARPQKLEIPPPLRPILREWWQMHGGPTAGLVFPALRGEQAGTGEKTGVSHAEAFRRDLKRAFGLERWAGKKWVPVELDKYTDRQRELFTDTATTRPVDFHSWRRAFNQALADAEVNAQQAAALAGHGDLGAHMRYLANTAKARAMPAAALPDLLITSGARTIHLEAGEPVASSPPDSDAISGASWQAVCDSNAWPSAPEADALSS